MPLSLTAYTACLTGDYPRDLIPWTILTIAVTPDIPAPTETATTSQVHHWTPVIAEASVGANSAARGLGVGVAVGVGTGVGVAVVLKFSSKDAARAWYVSEEYVKVKHLRTDNTEGIAVLADQFQMPG